MKNWRWVNEIVDSKRRVEGEMEWKIRVKDIRSCENVEYNGWKEVVWKDEDGRAQWEKEEEMGKEEDG